MSHITWVETVAPFLNISSRVFQKLGEYDDIFLSKMIFLKFKFYVVNAEKGFTAKRESTLYWG